MEKWEYLLDLAIYAAALTVVAGIVIVSLINILIG